MNPSGEDFAYQTALAERGAWLEYDMIGMDFFYADQQAQSPSDEENARAIGRLRDAGLLGNVLISPGRLCQDPASSATGAPATPTSWITSCPA